MAAKTERIEMRTDPQSSAKIAQAAEVQHVSVSAFVLEAAVEAADRILARADVTIMPAEQFDQLIESLDAPDEAPALARLARKPRRYTRS